MKPEKATQLSMIELQADALINHLQKEIRQFIPGICEQEERDLMLKIIIKARLELATRL